MSHHEQVKHLDPSWQNNSRSIAESYMDRYTRTPSEFWANRLEEIGIPVDHYSNEISEPETNLYQIEGTEDELIEHSIMNPGHIY